MNRIYDYGTNPKDGSRAQRIGLPQGQHIVCEGDIGRFVEQPAREACIDLFQKNILTVSSSAHNGEQTPYIDLDVQSLNEDNANVLKALIQDGRAELIAGQESQSILAKIRLDNLRADRSPEEVSKGLFDIVANFTTQPLTWGYYQIDELKKLYGYQPEEYVTVSVDDFVEQGFVFDEATGMLFESEELIDQYRIGNEVQ